MDWTSVLCVPISASAGNLLTLAQAATTTGADAAADPTAAAQSKTLFEFIRDGGPLGFLLMGMSVLGVGLMIRNLLALRMSVLLPEVIVTQLATVTRQGNADALGQYCAEPANDSFITRIFRAALSRCALSPLGMMEIRSALQDAGSAEVKKLGRLNDHLAILAAVGPMLGLLGTVVGMIGAFGAIGQLQGIARSNQLAQFMAMALVNTAQGLVVAIPCTIAFALFKRRIERVAADAASVAEALAPFIERMTPAGGRPAPRAVPGPAARPAPIPAPPVAAP